MNWLIAFLISANFVVTVIDGDTFRIDNTTIRLFGIDCPESNQPYGQKAMDFTANMIEGNFLEIQKVGQDRYGRILAIVTINGINLNENLVWAGLAHVDTRYCKLPICIGWLAGEEIARLENVGLWKQGQPIPPWVWRKK